MAVMLTCSRIGGLCNGPTSEAEARQAIDWAKERYPGIWEELMKIGFTEDGKFRVGWYARTAPIPTFIDA